MSLLVTLPNSLYFSTNLIQDLVKLLNPFMQIILHGRETFLESSKVFRWFTSSVLKQNEQKWGSFMILIVTKTSYREQDLSTTKMFLTPFQLDYFMNKLS